ncbi:hypothetical protein D6825_02635, partial [Candidatus Woesearchaeota archaeon]
EVQFEGLPDYLKAYRSSLVSFLRSEKFRERTGYDSIALLGTKKPINKSELKEHNIFHAANVRTPLEELSVYTVNLRNPSISVSLTNKLIL